MNISRKQPSLARIRGGATAKRAGDDFQKSIYLSAKTSGVVTLQELPSCGAKFVGKGRIVRQNMPCDFIGSVQYSGIGIFFDAKQFGPKTASIDFQDKSHVKPHQLTFLASMAKCGAVAGFLVRSEHCGEYLWMMARDAIGRKKWDSYEWFRVGSIEKPLSFEQIISCHMEIPR